MNIQEYFTVLNSDAQSVFSQSLSQKDKLGKLHNLSSCIYEFSSFVLDPQEQRILVTVSAQLESSNYNLALGLYRQAFTSLRLALEMGLAAIFFSASKLELYEWLDGRLDIKWSILIDEDNGVLSKRFTKAFFCEMSDEVEKYRAIATNIYRKLSEYVHGNNETWENGSIKIIFSDEMFERYCDYYKAVGEVILFATTCRYVKLLTDSDRESLQFIPDEFGHISTIRELFGRS